MISNIDLKLIKYIIEYINSDKKLFNLFNHHKQQYNINELFEALIIKLKTGIPYNNISNVKSNIKGGNLFYFHKKLIKLNFFQNFFDNYICLYLNEISPNITKFYIDSTLIANKLGIDLTKFNVQLKKHKSSKISIIVDEFSIPINVKIDSSSVHDVNIVSDQIDDIVKKYPNLCTNNNLFIGDAGYDSSKLSAKIKSYKLGTLITYINKRNTKDPEKLLKIRPDLYTKLLLKSRYKVEHINNTIKQNKNINCRYDKQASSYNSFVLLALIRITFSKIGKL